MSEDVRQSLTSWGSILLFAGIICLFGGLIADVDLPEWVIWLGLGLNFLGMFDFVRHFYRNRHREHADG